jgi:hypothetical protein
LRESSICEHPETAIRKNKRTDRRSAIQVPDLSRQKDETNGLELGPIESTRGVSIVNSHILSPELEGKKVLRSALSLEKGVER